MPDILTPPPVTDPLARSHVYKMIALAFKYPTEELFEAYRSGDYVASLWEGLSEIPHAGEILIAEAEWGGKVKAGLASLSQLDLEVQYNKLFEVGTPEPPCPPNEGIYRKDVDRSGIMIEIAEFYKHFGLRISNEEGKQEMPDHLRAELEFLHFLTFKEAQARQENAEDFLRGYLRAQKDFLDRHILPWAPEFVAKVQASAAPVLYAGAARVLLSYVQADREYVAQLFAACAPEAGTKCDGAPLAEMPAG